MRDLRPTDRIAEDFRSIEDEHGTFLPMCWKDLKDWAQWWLRQEELYDFVNFTDKQHEFFKQVLTTGDNA